MRHHPLMLLATAALLLFGVVEARAQSDRIIGVRTDKAGEVILFAIDPLGATERKIATLQKAGAGVRLLGMTALNARRGTFTYAYTDTAAAKDYLHTVSVTTGQTVARVALPADTGGLQVIADARAGGEAEMERNAILRKIENLEQEVRRLQSQVRSR